MHACMAQERNTNCCRCCFGTLLSLGLTAAFLWLTLRTSPPKCTLQSLYLPSFTSPHHKNDTLFFNLSLQNDNKDKSIKYGAVLFTFAIFLDNITTRPLANATLEPFYQGRSKTARKWGSARVPRDGRAIATANRSADATVRNNGKVFVRVEFTTRVRYKIWTLFYVKRQRLVGGANVEVNASSGEKVEPKGIRLGEMPPRLGSQAAKARSCYVAFLGVLVTGLFLTAFT
ncbi:Protein NDR1 [Glycine soja]